MGGGSFQERNPAVEEGCIGSRRRNIYKYAEIRKTVSVLDPGHLQARAPEPLFPKELPFSSLLRLH